MEWRQHEQCGYDDQRGNKLCAVRNWPVSEPHKKVAGNNTRKQAGACKERHAKRIFAAVQIQEGKKNPQSRIEKSDGPAEGGKRRIKQVGKSEAELGGQTTAGEHRKYCWNQYQNRHGDALFLNKVRACQFLTGYLGHLCHAWNS